MPSRRKHVFRRRSTLRRRNNQSGGGKLSLIPFDGTPKPGEPVPYFLSTVKRIQDDIKENWEYYMVGAHGLVIPTEYSVVPDDTYIIFNAPAGCNSYAGVVPFPETLVAASDDLFYNNMYLAHRKAIHRLHAVSTKTPILGGDTEFLLRTLAPSEREGLKKCPYPDEFYSNTFARNTRSLTSFSDSCYFGSPYVAKTIYGPGESYPNMKLTFRNNINFLVILLGLYKLPIRPDIYNNLIKLSTDLQADYKPFLDKYRADPVKGLTKEQKNKLRDAALLMDIGLFSEKGIFGSENLIGDLIGRDVTLEKVVERLPKLPPTKSRFIFVDSCRGIAEVPAKPDANAAKMATLMRQASVGTENAEIAKLKENVKAAAGAYYAPATPAAGAAAAATGGAGTGTTL